VIVGVHRGGHRGDVEPLAARALLPSSARREGEDRDRQDLREVLHSSSAPIAPAEIQRSTSSMSSSSQKGGPPLRMPAPNRRVPRSFCASTDPPGSPATTILAPEVAPPRRSAPSVARSSPPRSSPTCWDSVE